MTVVKKTIIATVLAVGAIVMFIVAGGAMTGHPLNTWMLGGGAMGGGNGWMLIPALLWMWIPTIVMFAFGIFLVWITVEGKYMARRNR